MAVGVRVGLILIWLIRAVIERIPDTIAVGVIIDPNRDFQGVRTGDGITCNKDTVAAPDAIAPLKS